MRPCFQFFDFCISYTNLCFYLQEVVIKKWFFHHFFLYDHYNQHQTNTESKDFVLIFSGKSLVNDLIMVNWSEFTKLTMRFYLLLAAQISGWRTRCLRQDAILHQLTSLTASNRSFENGRCHLTPYSRSFRIEDAIKCCLFADKKMQQSYKKDIH